MRHKVWYILLLLLLAFTSCSSVNEAKTDKNYKYKLFYIDSNESKVVTEGYEPESTTDKGLLAEFIIALSKSPENYAYKKAKPDDVVIRDYELNEDGQLLLYFDSAYNNMNKINEILCRAVIVKTLCQVDSIDYVEFYVNGQPLMIEGELPVGRMRSEDFIDNTGGETIFSQENKLKIYFASSTGDYLLESIIMVPNDGLKTQEALILEQLIAGPLKEQTDLYPVIPEGTKLLSVSTKEGICSVDFSQEFLSKIEGITDEIAIYSVVDSLAELASVNKVQFTINGETKKLYQNIEFNGLFERNLDLIKNETKKESTE